MPEKDERNAYIQWFQWYMPWNYYCDHADELEAFAQEFIEKVDNLLEGGDNMPDFHETPMGRRFFERDVPELIEVLKSIAESLKVGADFEKRAFGIKEPKKDGPALGGPDILPHKPK